MLRIAMEEVSHSFSVDSPRNSGSLSFPPLMIDGLSRKSFSYSKLPEQPLKLSVRKLDGSCFDIEVMKTASIAELRLAVEAAFSHMPKKGPGKISWPHVWGHFCLSYDGQKLISEIDYIRHYGIKDGDQLQFIRHHSINHIMTEKQSKKQAAAKQRYMLTSQSYISISNEKYQDLSIKEDYDCEDVESGWYRDYRNEDESLDTQNDSRVVHLLRGWFSYSWQVSGERTRYKCKSYPSRACDFLDGFRNIIQLYGSKNYYRRSTCRKD